MIKTLTITTCFLILSSIAIAEEVSTTQPCANGGGIVIKGVVTNHEYCLSKNKMNWWNAVAWCDAQGRRLFNLGDCTCNGTTNCREFCPELKNPQNDNGWESIDRVWTSNHMNKTHTHAVWVTDGTFHTYAYDYYRRGGHNYALCY